MQCCQTERWSEPFFLDINECTINNGGCSHQCFNIPGAFYCGCPKGLTMGLNNLTCVGKQWQISHLRDIGLLQAAWILF